MHGLRTLRICLMVERKVDCSDDFWLGFYWSKAQSCSAASSQSCSNNVPDHTSSLDPHAHGHKWFSPFQQQWCEKCFGQKLAKTRALHMAALCFGCMMWLVVLILSRGYNFGLIRAENHFPHAPSPFKAVCQAPKRLSHAFYFKCPTTRP